MATWPTWNAYCGRLRRVDLAALGREEVCQSLGEMELAEMAVYFLLAPHSMCVKIGYTKSRPGYLETRLRHLQCGSPEPYILLGSIEGNKADERDIHKDFSGDRLRGEWFRLSQELREFLNTSVIGHSYDEAILSRTPNFDASRWNCDPLKAHYDLCLDLDYQAAYDRR